MSRRFCRLARSAPNILRSFPVLLLSFALSALTPELAKAGVTADDQAAANVAVDLFVKAGQAAGLPISDREAGLVKEIVSCGVSGADLGICAKNMIVRVALQEAGASEDVKQVATCLLGGTNVIDCGTRGVLSKLPPEAQPMATCLINGGKITDCGKKLAEGLLINKVPADVQPIVKCMVDRGDPKACGTEFVQQQVQKNLPPAIREQAGAIVGCLSSGQNAVGCVTVAAAPDELKPLVTCAQAPGANVSACMAQFAADNLPPGTPAVAKDMIGCIGNSANFADCAKDKGIAAAQDLVKPVISQAEKDALNAALATLDKLRPDAPMAIEAGPNNTATLQNILKVGQGVKDKNWGMVVMGAGPELAIVASNILLSIFITPALAAVLSPAVSAMIHNDVAAAQKAFDAAKSGDAVGLSQVIFEWYANSFIDKPCAILGKDVQDTVCGEMSKAIQFISTHAADLAKGILGEGKKILEWIGVWGLVDDVATFAFDKLKGAVEAIGDFLGFGDKEDEWRPAASCGPLLQQGAEGYFANKYLSCVTPATDGAMAYGAVDTSRLDSKCNSDFLGCIAPSKRAGATASVNQTCGAMATQLVNLARGASQGIKATAEAYTQMGGPANYVNDRSKEAVRDEYGAGSRDFCQPNFWDAATKQAYATVCAKFVNKQFPLPPSAAMGGPACDSLMTPASAARQACLASLNANLSSKASLVGPDSEYCKRQQKWIADHPCEWVKTGKTFDIPGFSTPLEDIVLKCKEKLAPNDVFTGTRIVPTLPTPPAGGGTRITIPGTRKLNPLGGGSSGISMIDGRTGNSPSSKSDRLKSGATVKVPPIGTIKLRPQGKPPSVAGRPGGSSGTNFVSGGNAAINRLSGDGMGGGFRPVGSSGSSGVISGPNRRASGPGGNTMNSRSAGTGSNTSHSGGSSGVSLSRPIEGGGVSRSQGSSGYSTVNSQSGNAPARSRSEPLDYGGCSSCNKPDTFRQPK